MNENFKNCAVLLSMFLALVFSPTVKAQRIKDNKIDEFTKERVVRTKWCAFTKNRRNQSIYRITRIDSTIWLDLQVEASKYAYVISEGDPLMFLLNDGSTINLHSEKIDFSRGGVPRKGKDNHKRQSTLTSFRISQNAKDSLMKGSIVKFRVYWSNGFMEEKDKYKVNRSIKKSLTLVTTGPIKKKEKRKIEGKWEGAMGD